jgi:predicted Fe-Mo cluster-binding NifX family protein
MAPMKVAIPYLGEIIAPRFEAARYFLVITQEKNRKSTETHVECAGPEGYRRVRLLQIHRVGTLICNGIKGSYRDMLAASGISVIQNVTGPVRPAIKAFLAGDLRVEAQAADVLTTSCDHQALIGWARELFEQHGYQAEAGPGEDSFLVDLVARITCPVCGRMVKVAVCCGAHTYNATHEIVEFHHTTGADYDARVYVCPANPTVAKFCREYGIELLDPEAGDTQTIAVGSNKLPILKGPVRNHERASMNIE